MGILSRFSDIIKANINDMLDKAEDPGKMCDQYLRQLTDDLAEVKEQTAGVMAEETRTKRLVDENNAEVERYDGLARQALQKGNEDDARTFLAKKQQLETKQQDLETTYEAAHENATKMRQMHDKLVSDIDSLNARREGIKAKVAVAKTQDEVSKVTSGGKKTSNALNAFDRMEEKADNMLDKSNAMQELNEEPVDAADSLAKQYSESGNTASVDDELAKMKAEMGLADPEPAADPAPAADAAADAADAAADAASDAASDAQ